MPIHAVFEIDLCIEERETGRISWHKCASIGRAETLRDAFEAAANDAASHYETEHPESVVVSASSRLIGGALPE